MYYLYDFCNGEILTYKEFSNLYELVEYLRSNYYNLDDTCIYYGKKLYLEDFQKFLDI